MTTQHEKVTSAHPPAITTYLVVYFLLLVLLVATVACASLHLGKFNIVLAMIIAIVKAGLVLWYFMHLRESPRLILMFMGIAVVTLIIGGILSESDYITR